MMRGYPGGAHVSEQDRHQRLSMALSRNFAPGRNASPHVAERWPQSSHVTFGFGLCAPILPSVMSTAPSCCRAQLLHHRRFCGSDGRPEDQDVCQGEALS